MKTVRDVHYHLSDTREKYFQAWKDVPDDDEFAHEKRGRIWAKYEAIIDVMHELEPHAYKDNNDPVGDHVDEMLELSRQINAL
tara:strand:- start:1902 stop:2150 length:249 start_codon:yes stop_codon:yes gene_type:complete